MANDWTPPSDGVATGSSFVPPSDAVKKKDLTASGLVKPSSERLSTTTTIKPTVSSSSKGKPDGTYSFPGEDNAIYKKENGQWFKSFKGEYKYYPITKGDVQNRIQSLEKNAVSLENYSFEKPEPKITEVPKELQGDRNTIQYWDKLLASGKINKKIYDYHAERIASSDFGQAVTKAAAPKPKQTASQKAEQKLFETSFGALDVNDPEYLRRKAQSEKIDKSLSLVTPDFVNDNEGDVVPVVQRIIKDYPYLQVAESGFGYDELRIVNTVTGEDAIVNLENWSSSRDKEEANILRGFLDVQMNSKDYIEQKQKVDKLQAQMQTATPTQRIELSQKMLEEKAKLNELSTGRYNYAKNDKYKAAAIYDKNAKENIKTDFAKLQIQSIDYSEKVKSYNEWNATVNEARKNGTITEEQYNTEYAPKLEAEKNMLVEEKNKINQQVIETKDKSVSIDNIAANQYAIQAERGNVLSGTTYSFLQGAENSLRFLLETGDFKDGEFKGLLTEAAPGSISDVYTSAEGRNTFEQIVFGLANSGGSALVGAAVGAPFLGLYASSYVNMKDQMNTPEFKDVPEYQKILMSGVYGATVGVLEKYGVSKWFTKTPAGKGLTNWILKRTIAELGEDASAEAVELAVKKNLNAAITSGLIQVTSAGVVEGSTELAQEAADMVYKDVFNRMSGKEYFQNPKTWAEVADRLGQSFILGLAGGAGMQSITQATQVGLNELNKAQINNITDLIESPELKDTFKLHLKDQIISGEITKDEAKRQIDKINQVEGVLNKIPSNVDRFEAFKLITERDELQKEIAGKDPALVAAQTERVNAINDELKQLSYAVQEQATSQVPVQPEARVGGEMAQGEPEARPQEVTQEGGQAQEVNELQAVRDRILKIEEAKKKGELLEDSQPGELKSLKQRESELVQEIEKPIVQETAFIEEQVKQPELNLVNNENINDVIESQDTETKQKIAKSAKLAMKAIPKAKIYLHNNTAEYDAAVGEETDGTEKGSFIASDGAIHINMSEALPHTLIHEAFHYVILNKGIDYQTLNGWAKGLRSIVKDKKLLDRLDRMTSQYSSEEQSEEFITELGAILGVAKNTLTTSGLQKFKILINKIAKKLGLPPVFTAASTTQDAVDFINTISRQLTTGDEINLMGISGVIDTTNVTRKKSILATGAFERYPVNPNTKVEENVPLSRFNGKRSNVFESDRMTGAFIADDQGNKLFNFFGGIFYPIITGKWWASNTMTKASGIARNSKRDADGYIYGTPIIMKPGSQMSNNDMLLATLELMKMDALKKNSGVTKAELMSYIEKAFDKKKISDKKNIIKNALKRSNNIEQIFDELEYTLFQEEGFIKDRSGNDILNDNGQRIKSLTFEERKEFVSGVLGDRKVISDKFPSAGSMSAMAEKFTEPETQKSKNVHDIVIVYRTKGDLVAKKSNKKDPFYHKSYPYEISPENQDGSSAEIEVFILDSAYNLSEAIKELTKSSGETFSYEEYYNKIEQGKYKSEKVALAQYGRTAKLSYASGEIYTPTNEEVQQINNITKNEFPESKLTPTRKKQVIRKEAQEVINNLPQKQFEELRDIAFDPAATPKKTVIAYKLFKVKKDRPGQVFPLFVNANEAVPTDVWMKAVAGPTTVENGKVKVKSKLGGLAYRPGWHSGNLPLSTHIGERSNPVDKKMAPDIRPSDQVWAEIEVSNDVDWQTEATKRAKTTKKGTIDLKTAHITDQLPVGGHYKYKTNSNMTGEWLISGEIKLTGKILTDEEVAEINSKSNTSDLKRLKPFDYEAYGFTKEGYPVDKKKAEVDQILDAYFGAKERGSNPELISRIESLKLKPSERKKQLIGKNAYLSKNVKDNLSVAKKMEADKKSPIDIRIATGWEKGVDNKWRYEIEDVKINNKLKDLSKGVIQTKNTSTPIPLSQVISKSNALLTAYPKLADTIIIVTDVVANNKSILGAHGLIDGKDIILLKAIKDYDLMESTLVHEIQHAIQEIEGFAKGTNVANTYKTKIALDRAVKLAAAEQKALDRNISFLSKGINTYDKLWAYFVDYVKGNLTAEENYDYVINKLGGESNLDLSNDYVIEYLKENSIPGIKDQKSLINMFEAKKLYDQVSGDLGYLSTAGEVESRNVEARRKMSAKERLNTLLSETENIPRSRQIIDGKIARKKQLVYNASPRSVEELGKRSGVVYFATDKREAEAYAEGNRGQVREFEIPEDTISDEKVVLDKINELGLQPKDKQYTVEESYLYELIDDRFDNSLSQADINKLFDALKKDGVTAFRYKDGAQVVEGTTESIAVIDTDVVQKSVVKKQKGFSKQDAINKAKEKYTLSVEERGNTPEQGVNSALEDLRKSDWYTQADDIMREEAERELKKFFGEKMKAAPSIKKVMATKPSKVQVEEMAALKSQIRLEARAAREAKGDLNAKRKALAAAITGMVRQGKITALQARSIINKVSRVNLDNPVMVDRLISYAERVFDRADYQETLSNAAKIRKSIKKAMKSKDLQAEVAAMAKKFSGVDPFMVEDIDQYIENAEKVLNAVRPVRDTEVPLRKAADIEAISDYTTNQIERQEANKRAELLALNEYLVDAGIITDDMTAKEIQEIIDIIASEEYEVENADKKINFLKNRFEFMAGVIEEMIVNNRDIFTDEPLDLTQSQKELMREVLKFDIDKLSVKQAAQVLEAMDNFINNGITSGLEAVVKNYIGNENANKLAASGIKSRPLKMYWNKAVGRFFGEQFVSLPLLIERMFPGMKKGLKLMSEMGLTDVIRGAAKADREHKMIVKDYTSQDFYKGKGFMKAENVYERGMIAFLSRNLAGTKTEMRNEFLRRIKMVEESINALMTGSETERKMGEVYQQVFDKLKVNSQDLDVIKANAEQMNLDAVDWMTQQWAEKYSELSDISLSVYNAILGSDTNYTPDRYKGLDESDIELDENLLQKGSAFMGGLEHTDKNKSGVLIETTRPKVLPKGRFVSLDFDVNNFSSLKGAMIDIETAPAIRQVDGFIKSDGYKKIVNGDDRKILTRRINNYIISVKGKTAFNRDSMKSVERLANFLGSLGVGKALGGFDQTIKQTAPVIINTLINAGRFDGLNLEMNAAINRSGMPIANRGIEAVSGVESVDALIDKKGATAAEIGKAIEKVSQMYMKVLLSRPDVWVARSSFISYYKNYLKTNGMSTDIDWKTHEWNQEAMNYAQMMVDRQQNISDEKLAGSFMNSPDPWKSVTRKVILPFATFIINQKNRMHNDLIALFGVGAETSLEDKKKAARSLIGLSAEMLAYQGIAYFIKTMVYDQLASYITGEDDEEEKKERSFFGIKMTNKEWNATKFPVKSLVSDVISPFPLFDDAVVFGFDELMSNFPMISDEDIKKAIQDQNDARALKGQEPMDAEQEANLIQSLKDKNTYKVTFQKESLGRQYGVPGIAFDTYTELAEMAQLAYTGEFEDDMGFGPKKKYISKKDQELVKWSLIPMVLYSTGLVPKDAGVVARKVVNTVKKRSISETKFNNTNELKKELGRKPKDWEESLVMNTTKKVPTLVEAIKFAERFGGLTESQGKEYAKLIEITGDYGYLDLKRIQDGETADQILKK